MNRHDFKKAGSKCVTQLICSLRQGLVGVSAALKNFKASAEVETFYTFIHENGLRSEAHKLMELVVKKITPPKKRGRKKMLQ